MARDGDASDEAPLIVTLAFDAPSFEHFQSMRGRHFPPARNHIPAHLTLFHHLPGTEATKIARVLRSETRGRATIPLRADGLRFLGYGCAYEVEAPDLSALRADLSRSFSQWLTPQDRQGFRPHVTIQNKAPAGEAKALFAELSAGFEPFEATGTGLLLWHYRGGPWEAAGEFPFASA